jgi:hypothetical protein
MQYASQIIQEWQSNSGNTTSYNNMFAMTSNPQTVIDEKSLKLKDLEKTHVS